MNQYIWVVERLHPKGYTWNPHDWKPVQGCGLTRREAKAVSEHYQEHYYGYKWRLRKYIRMD